MKKLTLTDLLILFMAVAGFALFFTSGLKSTVMLGVAAGWFGILYFVLFRRELVSGTFGFFSSSLTTSEDMKERRGHSGYIVGLMLILALSAALLSYRLGEQDLHGDEFQVVSAATGHLHTGNYYLWDFSTHDIGCRDDTRQCRYIRAWPHTTLITQAYKVFGISEWSSRIVSVFFGILLVALSYFFTTYFVEDRRIALLVALLFSISPFNIHLGRFARMYVLLAPLFLVLAYLFFRALTGTSDLRFIPWQRARAFVERNLHFDFRYLAGALMLLWLTYEIHINVLIIIPALLLFVLLMAIITRERRYRNASMVGILGLASFSVAFYFGAFLFPPQMLGFLERTNLVYAEFLTRFPLPYKVGIVLLLLGLMHAMFRPIMRIRTKLLYLYVIVLFSFAFFAFAANRYSSPNYISHVTPISAILITYFFVHLAFRFRSRLIQWTMISILPVSAAGLLAGSWSSLYKSDNRFGDFSVAYRVIIEQYDPEHDVIVSPMPRDYYLQGMPVVPTIISVPQNSAISFEAFVSELRLHESGWITWETKERTDLRKNIQQYISSNFQKVAGHGMDEHRVEIYYFNRAMMPEHAASE